MARLRERPITRIAAGLEIAGSRLHCWLRQANIDDGRREGLTSEGRAELVRLRRASRVPGEPVLRDLHQLYRWAA